MMCIFLFQEIQSCVWADEKMKTDFKTSPLTLWLQILHDTGRWLSSSMKFSNNIEVYDAVIQVIRIHVWC